MRRLVSAVAAAAAIALVACSDDGSGRGGLDVLDPGTSGLVLIDCWHDVAYELDAETGRTGAKRALFADPGGDVMPADDCRELDRENGPGISIVSADGARRGATKSFDDDGARHVGYIDVRTGAFTDLSERLKLDAFGEPTDEGSGTDDFAGPILDRLIGFGADGRFYLRRAESVFSAPGPDFAQFTRHEADPVLGVRLTPDGRGALSDYDTAVAVEVGADAPPLAPYERADERYLGEDARYAPLVFSAADERSDAVPTFCRDLAWIDATHLLCDEYTGEPGVIDVTEAVLAPAAQVAETRGCGECYGREYVWLMPDGAYRPLAPRTQRELSGFAVEPGTAQVLFLASDGEDVRLYSAGTGHGSTPQVRGEFSLGDDAPPGLEYLALRFG